MECNLAVDLFHMPLNFVVVALQKVTEQVSF